MLRLANTLARCNRFIKRRTIFVLLLLAFGGTLTTVWQALRTPSSLAHREALQESLLFVAPIFELAVIGFLAFALFNLRRNSARLEQRVRRGALELPVIAG